MLLAKGEAATRGDSRQGVLRPLARKRIIIRFSRGLVGGPERGPRGIHLAPDPPSKGGKRKSRHVSSGKTVTMIVWNAGEVMGLKIRKGEQMGLKSRRKYGSWYAELINSFNITDGRRVKRRGTWKGERSAQCIIERGNSVASKIDFRGQFHEVCSQKARGE